MKIPRKISIKALKIPRPTQGAIDDQIRADRACGDIFTAFKFSQSFRHDTHKRAGACDDLVCDQLLRGFLLIQILRRKASRSADRDLCRSLRGRIFHERFVLRIF